ncbi:hypothetical protein ERN12_11320 [Rhodobacteraceae bacterium]|nr:hypothetical protein ERN12_11320 [Paracoccaceae bacterium]
MTEQRAVLRHRRAAVLSLLIVLFSASLVHSSPVVASQMACDARQNVITALFARYREVLQARRPIAPDITAELLIAPSGTWTILASYEDGRSCLVGSGVNHPAPAVPARSRNTGNTAV